MLNFLSGVATLWNLTLFFVVVATLVWFLYSFALRRIVRARRIEGLRMKRLMREAAERKREAP
ncbi:MAG TPA: hypothetical protein VKB77_05235 [Terriglobales bacterium]|nr:hypothetical protein [Terriglobales bacterium]